MVADDDGDADDDFPAIGAESQLKTLGVTAFHISPKEGAGNDENVTETGSQSKALRLPTALGEGVKGYLHSLYLEWRPDDNPHQVMLEEKASVSDLIKCLVECQYHITDRTRATSYLITIADEDGDPDDDLPPLSHNSHLNDFMAYGAGFHLAAHGEPDPPESEIDKEASIDTFHISVPWEFPTSGADSGPDGWGISGEVSNLTAHAMPGEAVSALVSRVSLGEREYNRARYRLQRLGTSDTESQVQFSGAEKISSLDPRGSYVLLEDGCQVSESRYCLDTALIKLPWVTSGSEEAATDRSFEWKGRGGGEGQGMGQDSAQIQAVRACPDTRVKALVEAIASFHLLPPEKCSLSRAGGMTSLPLDAPLYSLGIPELIFDFVLDEQTWRESMDAIEVQERHAESLAASSTPKHSEHLHSGGLGNDTMQNRLLLSHRDTSSMNAHHEYRVILHGEGRQAWESTLLIDKHQITTQRVHSNTDNPWYQFAASIEKAETQPISNIRSVSVMAPPEDAKFTIVFRPDRPVTYTVLAHESHDGKSAVQKRDDIVLHLLKLQEYEHGGQLCEWPCMMRTPKGKLVPQIVGVDRVNFYYYEPRGKGLFHKLGFGGKPKRDSRKLLHLKSIDLHPSLTTVFTMVFNEGSELKLSEDVETIYEASSAEECESIVAHIRKLCDVARAQHEINARGRIRAGSSYSRRASV